MKLYVQDARDVDMMKNCWNYLNLNVTVMCTFLYSKLNFKTFLSLTFQEYHILIAYISPPFINIFCI